MSEGVTSEGVQSANAEHIRYRPVRRASRKGSKERTTGHEWRCMTCNGIVHEETVIGFDHDETDEEVQARHTRIQKACQGHSPCPMVGADDPELPKEE